MERVATSSGDLPDLGIPTLISTGGRQTLFARESQEAGQVIPVNGLDTSALNGHLPRWSQAAGGWALSGG